VRLLWVDDDAPERFQYEATVLTEDYRIEIMWARSVAEAVQLLSKRTYEAVVLDQMLPFKSDSVVSDYWGGCVILHWLKRSKYPSSAPPAEDPSVLLGTPLAANVHAPVCFVSAFSDDDVHRELLRACDPLLIFPKPLELKMLEEFLRAALSRQPAEAE
jgi:DNA-binding response OmpR family regulator